MILLRLLFLLTLAAHAAVIRTDFDMTSTGQEYLSISDDGTIAQLDASAKILHAQLVIRKDSLAPLDRVLPKLIHLRTSSSNYLIWGVISAQSSSVRWYDVISKTSGSIVRAGLKDVVVVGGSNLVVLDGSGISRIDLSKSSPGGNWTSVASGAFQSIQSSGDTLWGGTPSGQIQPWIVTNGAWSTGGTQGGALGSNLRLGPISQAAAGEIVTAGITKDGDLVYWTSSKGVATVGTNRNGRDLAIVRDGSTWLIRLIDASGRWMEWQIPSVSPRWHLRTAMEKFGFLRDGAGRLLPDESGVAPSGWAQITNWFAKLFGLYHHAGGTAVTRFDVDPNPWSPRQLSSVLVRYAVVGDKRCSSSVTIHSDSNSISFRTLQARQELDYGITDLRWDGKEDNGNDHPSSVVWVRLSVRSETDSLHIWKPLLLDRSATKGSPSLSWSGTMVPTGDTMFLHPKSKLRISWFGVVDTPVSANQILRSTMLSRVGMDAQYSFPMSVTDSVQEIIGLDAAGIGLPDGTYQLGLSVRDSAKNDSAWNSPFAVSGFSSGSKNIRWFAVRSFRPAIEASFDPIMLRSALGYRGTLRWKIAGIPGEVIRLTLNVNGSMAPKSQSGVRWLDTSIVLGVDGNFQWSGEYDLPPTGNIKKGMNRFDLLLRNSDDDSARAVVAFAVDRLETIITSPTENQQTRGTVEVRGIATSPTLEGGFDSYLAYWAPGNLTLPASPKTVADLLAGASWKGMPVPLVNQSRTWPAGLKVAGRDLDYPESNRGVQAITSVGPLAYFAPSDTGWYTLLVVSQGKDSASKTTLSWDSKRVHWTNSGAVGNDSIVIRDSLATTATSSTLDHSDSTHAKDSLVFLLKSSGALEADLLLVEGTFPPEPSAVGAQAWRGRISLAANSPSRWTFRGTGMFGQYLDSGVYSLVVEGFSANGQKLRAVRQINYRPPPFSGDESNLSINPNPAVAIPTLGIIPKVSFKVRNTNRESGILEVRSEIGDSLIRLLDGSTDSIVTVSWDFRAGGKDQLEGWKGSREFQVLWVPVEHPAHAVRKLFSVRIEEAHLLDSVIPVLKPVPEGQTWNPDLQTNFKFKALATGTLQYFPIRKVDYAPYASGQQVIRTYKTVPWSIEYRKFYNSAEVVAEGSYNRSGYTDGEGVVDDKRWEREVNVRADALNSYYNFENSRGMDVVSDSGSFINGTNVFFGDSSRLNLPFGIPTDQDFAKLPVMPGFAKKHLGWRNYYEIQYQTLRNSAYRAAAESLRARGGHACDPFDALNTYDWEYANRCKVFAISEEGEIADKKYDDVWTSVGARSNYRPVSAILYQKTPESQLSKGKLIFKTIMRTTDYNTDIPVRVGVLNADISGYWTKRTNRSNGYASNYALKNDKWDNDADYQANYLDPLSIDWNHPYFLVKAFRQDSLNFWRITNGRSQWQDLVPWGQSSGSGSNGEKADSAWNLVGDTVYTDLGGAKVGIRGFAFRGGNVPLAPLTSRFGVSYTQYQYIKNFFDRRKDSGMAYWAYQDPHDRYNSDELLFAPRLDTSLPFFGVTWDTTTIPYPYGDMETPQGQYWEKYNDTVVAFYSEQGTDWHPFAESDTGRFLMLRSHFFPDSVTSIYVDSAVLDLKPFFAKLIAKTDSTNRYPNKYFGYVRRNSLKFQLPLMTYAQGPGQGGGVLDTSLLYHSVIIDSDSLLAKVYYNNRPTLLGNWSSAMDSTFQKTKGWIYGAGAFNSQAFRAQDSAVSGGFLGLINPQLLDSATTWSMAPFRRVCNNNKIIDASCKVDFNPSLKMADFKWKLQVYQADGATPNADLDSLGTSTRNFNLGLASDRTSHSYIALRGKTPASVILHDTTWTFKNYSVFVRKANDTASFEMIPVNQAYVSDTSGILVGDILPRTSLDFWERDTADTVAPVLAWWNVARLTGSYEVMVLGRFVDPQSGAERLLTERKPIVVGKIIDTGRAQIEAPYRRASLSMPAGATAPGTSITVNTVSKSDLLLDATAPEILPIGPVVEVQTTGKKVFDSLTMPSLEVRLTAKEIFVSEGRQDFTDSLRTDSVVAFIRRNLYKYQIHMLSTTTNKLDALPTIAVVDSGFYPHDVVLKLSALVPHFSVAMVLREDGHEGRLPLIKGFSSESKLLKFNGLYDGRTVPPDSVLFDTLPGDLEVLVRSAETGADTTALVTVRMVAVDGRGRFNDSIDLTKLSEGSYALVLRYRGSERAVRRVFAVQGAVFRTWDWSVSPDPVQSRCGQQVAQIRFSANQSGTAMAVWKDPLGGIHEQREIAYAIGDNLVGWDGCSEAMPARVGTWSVSFRFSADASQDRAVRVGVGQQESNGIKSISVSPSSFSPSVTDTSLVADILVTAAGVTADSMTLEVRSLKGANSKQLQLIALPTEIGIFRGRWDGRIGGSIADTGVYIVAVRMATNPQDLRETQIRVIKTKSPKITLVANPSLCTWPVAEAQISVATDQPLTAKLWLSNRTGETHSYLLGQQGFAGLTSGVSQFVWNAMDSLRDLPVRAVLQWRDQFGGGGLDTVPLQVDFVRPVLTDLVVKPSDSIFPDFDSSASLREGFPSTYRLTFQSNLGSKVVLLVRDPNGKVVRHDTLRIGVGSNQASWRGRDSLDSLVAEGRYSVSLRLVPDHKMDTGTILVSGLSVQVARWPQLVLSYASATASNVAFANTITSELKRLGLKSIWVLGPQSTANAFETRSDLTVAYLDQVLDTTLYSGGAWNRVFRHIRGGGRSAFCGSLPLSLVKTPIGVDTTLASTLALLGLANPYDPVSILKWRASQIIADTVRMNWVDSSQLLDLSYLQAAAGLRTDMIGKGVDFDTLQATGQVWSMVSGRQAPDSVTEMKYNAYGVLTPTIRKFIRRRAEGFYGRPLLWGQTSAEKSGAILVVHPFGDPKGVDSTARRQDLANDYARSIFRYFFSRDLSIAPFQVEMLPKGVKGFKRASTVPVRLRFTYLGDPGIDSAVIRVTDAQNAKMDTSIVFRGVDLRSRKDTTLVMGIDSNAAFGAHALDVRIQPFAVVGQQPTDTTWELNQSNNVVSVAYQVIDTVPPTMSIDGCNTAGFCGYISPKPEARGRNLTGTVTTRHGIGEVLVESYLLKGDSLMLVKKAKVPAASGAWMMAIPSGLPLIEGERASLKIVLTDDFGLSRTDDYFLKSDSTSPVISSWRIPGVAYDTGSRVPRTFLNPLRAYVLEAVATDVQGLALAEYRKWDSSETVVLAQSSVPAIGTAWSYQFPEGGAKPFVGLATIRVYDQAGNFAEKKLLIDADQTPPMLTLWSVGKTFLDSLRNDTGFSAAVIGKRPLYLHTRVADMTGVTQTLPVASETVKLVQSTEQSPSWKYSMDQGPDKVKRFVLGFSDKSSVSLQVKLDGVIVSDSLLDPYIRSTGDSALTDPQRDAVKVHPFQRFYQVALSKPMHVLEINACDSTNQCTTGAVSIESPLSDLQVVDSANDAQGRVPDFGEVYMRENVTTGVNNRKDAWVYWLVHSRDASSTSGRDFSGHPWILVDLDNDSTTGYVLPNRPGLSGFEKAIEILPGDGKDNGTGLRTRVLNYQVGDGWIQDVTQGERSRIVTNLDSTLSGGNQIDDPDTKQPGEGDQLLPTGTVAKAVNGLWEIGLRMQWVDLPRPVRWAMLPSLERGPGVYGGDSVLLEGNALRFDPFRLKPVSVDGFTDDWLPDSIPSLEAKSVRTNKADSIKIDLTVRNTGLRPVRGFKLRYFYTSVSGGASGLLSGAAPAWVRGLVTVSAPIQMRNVAQWQNYPANYWFVEVTCPSCILGSDSRMELGTLALTGAPVLDNSPDWSLEDDPKVANPKIPAWDLRERLIGGLTPPTVPLPPLVLNVSRTSGDQLNATVSSPVIFSSSVTDPEQRAVVVTWHHQPGTVKTGFTDTVWSLLPGAVSVRVRATDVLLPVRFAETTLVVWTGAKLPSAHGDTAKCNCTASWETLLRETAPWAALPALSGMPWSSIAPVVTSPRVEMLPVTNLQGVVANNPALPWVPALTVPAPGSNCVDETLIPTQPWIFPWIAQPSLVAPLSGCAGGVR